MLIGIAGAAIGVWLMAAPGTLGYDDPAAASHHIIGPLATSFAVVAIWESTRDVRRLNAVLAVILALETALLEMPVIAVVNTMACAAVIAVLALLPSPIHERYGGGWRELLDWRRRGRRSR